MTAATSTTNILREDNVVPNVPVKMIAGLLAFAGTLGVAEGLVGMSPARISLGNSVVPPSDAAVAAAVAVSPGKYRKATRRPVSMMAATTAQAGTGTGYDLQSWAKVSRCGSLCGLCDGPPSNV